MNSQEFFEKVQTQQDIFNKNKGVVYNKDSFGKKWRHYTRYLTFMFYKWGWHSVHVSLLHFAIDFVALKFVYMGMPIYAGVAWILAQIVDSCDGDLARAKNQQTEIMGVLDNYVHLVTLVGFWFILYLQTSAIQIVVILSLLSLFKYLRSLKSDRNRTGEKSKLFYLLAKPSDVAIIYALYLIFAVINQIDIFINIYFVYFIIGIIYETYLLVFKAYRETKLD